MVSQRFNFGAGQRASLVFSLVTLFLVLLLPSVLAQELIFPNNQDVEVTIPCENGGNYCSDSATCNLTTYYPNGSLLVYNQAMTNSVSYHNYTIGEDNVLIGEYRNNVVCIDGNNNGTSTFSFLITPSGQDRMNSGEGLSLFGSIVVMVIVAIFLFIISFLFQNIYGKIVFISLSSIIFISAVLFSMVIISQSLGGYEAFVNGYTTFLFVIKILAGLSVLILCLFSLWLAVKMWNIKRGFAD